jgi:hypothetical protein
MDQAQVRALLAGERPRLQRLLQADTGRPQAAELGDEVDDADRRDAAQTGMAVDQLLRARWAALERAEARLAAGSYGRSVRSGQGSPTSGWRPSPLPSRPWTRRPPASRPSGVRRGSGARRRRRGPPRPRPRPAGAPPGWGRPASRSRSSRTRRCRTNPWSRTTRPLSTSHHPSMTLPCPTTSSRTTPAASQPLP